MTTDNTFPRRIKPRDVQPGMYICVRSFIRKEGYGAYTQSGFGTVLSTRRVGDQKFALFTLGGEHQLVSDTEAIAIDITLESDPLGWMRDLEPGTQVKDGAGYVYTLLANGDWNKMVDGKSTTYSGVGALVELGEFTLVGGANYFRGLPVGSVVECKHGFRSAKLEGGLWDGVATDTDLAKSCAYELVEREPVRVQDPRTDGYEPEEGDVVKISWGGVITEVFVFKGRDFLSVCPPRNLHGLDKATDFVRSAVRGELSDLRAVLLHRRGDVL